jgi:hypothetical protein
MNMDAARRAHEELGADVVVIKKTSKEYAQEKDPPPCPSVKVNDRIIARNDTVTYEALKTELADDTE